VSVGIHPTTTSVKIHAPTVVAKSIERRLGVANYMKHKKRKSFAEIKAICDQFDDLPDGAFLAVLEEHGVSVEDLERLTRHENQVADGPTKKQSFQKP
jgi:hypothetical protein